MKNFRGKMMRLLKKVKNLWKGADGSLDIYCQKDKPSRKMLCFTAYIQNEEIEGFSGETLKEMRKTAMYRSTLYDNFLLNLNTLKRAVKKKAPKFYGYTKKDEKLDTKHILFLPKKEEKEMRRGRKK